MSVTDDARPPRPVALAAAGFGSVTLVNFRLSKATRSILPAPSMRRSAGFASGPCPRITETKEFFDVRMHREVGDRDVCRRGAEHRGDLLIDRGDVLRAGRAARGLAAQVEREDRRGLTVRGEQGAVGRKRQRADGRERRPGRRADETGGGRRRGRRDRKREYGGEFQAGAHLNTAPSLRVWVGKPG